MSKMNRKIILLFLALFSNVYSMKIAEARKNIEMAHKLKLVLSAGKHVYAEHKEIYSDVCQRLLRLNELCKKSQYCLIEKELNNYRDMLNRAQNCYNDSVEKKDPLIAVLFEDSQKACLTWLLALPSRERITHESMQRLCKAIEAKCAKMRSSLEAAMYRQEEFARGNDLSHTIPTNSAVTAWCLSLPQPEQTVRPRSHSLTFDVNNLLKTPELKRKLSSANAKDM